MLIQITRRFVCQYQFRAVRKRPRDGDTLLLAAVLWWFTSRPRPRLAASGLFLLMYAFGRLTVEFWRLPDQHIGYLFGGWFTMGHLLTLPMLIGGVLLLDEPAAALDLKESPATSALRALLVRHHLDLIALTRGAAGALLVTADEVIDQPGISTVVRDTVGAGDSFTGALAIGLLRGEDLSRVHQRAVDVAAFVCTKAGATPELLPEFKR